MNMKRLVEKMENGQGNSDHKTGNENLLQYNNQKFTFGNVKSKKRVKYSV